WGSRPVFLDRIPSRMRTRVVAAHGGDTGHFLVRRAVVDLLRGDLHRVEPLRPRPRKDTTGAGGHGGADGHTGTLQDHSRRPDTPLNGGLGKKHAVIQSGHLLPQGVVWPTNGHGSSLGRPPTAGQLIFRGIFVRFPDRCVRGRAWRHERAAVPAVTGLRARRAGGFPVARATSRSPVSQRGVTATPPVCYWRRAASGH